MVDIAQFSVYMQEAILKIDLPAHALKRAQAGRDWLERRAPPEWRMEMMSIHNGRVMSQVRLAWDDQNPLALAFRRDAILKRPDDRVSWARVADKFGFTGFGPDKRVPQDLGFLEMAHVVEIEPDMRIHVSDNIDCLFLDEAWATVLGELQWYPQPVSVRKIA